MKSIHRIEITQKLRQYKARARAEARQHWQEVVNAEAPAGMLATAFAAGLLISTIPVPMIDMAIAAYVMRRFSRLPRAPLLAAMAMTNNLVMAPVYATTPKLGGFALHLLAIHTPLAAPDAVAIQILVGYLLVALGLAVGGFALAGTGFYGYKTLRRPANATNSPAPRMQEKADN
jgi:hypothetical protein